MNRYLHYGANTMTIVWYDFSDFINEDFILWQLASWIAKFRIVRFWLQYVWRNFQIEKYI